MKYILDTYAWIEYFIGSKKGITVKHIIEDTQNSIVTLESCIAEIYLWCLREEKDFDSSFKIIKNCSSIIQINLANWIEAAKIRHENRKKIGNFGIMDAVILAKQKEIEFKIVTGDKHFKNLKNVVFLE